VGAIYFFPFPGQKLESAPHFFFHTMAFPPQPCLPGRFMHTAPHALTHAPSRPPASKATDPRVAAALKGAFAASIGALNLDALVHLARRVFYRAAWESASAPASPRDDDDFVRAVRASGQTLKAYALDHVAATDTAFYRALMAAHAAIFDDIHALDVALAAGIRRQDTWVRAIRARDRFHTALLAIVAVYNYVRP